MAKHTISAQVHAKRNSGRIPKNINMMNSNYNFTTIDEYISIQPEELQPVLKNIRAAIKEAAPEATEKISYMMPTFYLNGNLVHFAVFKNHISFFPSSSGIKAFKKELKDYETSKGTIRFPLDKPVPLDLIKKITLYRYKKNRSKKK